LGGDHSERYRSALGDIYGDETIPLALDVSSLYPRKNFQVLFHFSRVDREQGVSASESKTFFDLGQGHTMEPIYLHSFNI
jgi:hypothetical protein